MKVAPDLYKHLEVNQVIALDQSFSHKKGTLNFVSLGEDKRPLTGYMAEPGEEPLTQSEKTKLSRILYGWGPKVHSAPKNEAEVALGSFAKIKNSQHKSMMHLVPLNVIRGVSDVYTDNFALYGEDWKRLPKAQSIFYDAALRHLEAWQSGEEYDPEDGKMHIIKVVANFIFVAWHELMGKGKDA